MSMRTILVICVTSAAWAFSFGLGSQVVTHWLKGLGFSDTLNGPSHSCYYLGLAVGSCAIPWLNRRLGPVACTAAGLILSALTLAIFPWTEGIWVWYALRFASGWAGAMCVVPLETIVSHESPSETKTRNFAFYGVSITVGGAAGFAIGNDLYAPGAAFPFLLGAAFPALASLLLVFAMPRRAAPDESNEPTHPLEWRRNFLSYGTAWSQGFLEGGMVAFLSFFLMSRGFSQGESGVLMGVTMVGVILFQVPVAWLADRYGRVASLLGCYAAVAVLLIAIPSLSHSVVLAAGLFCFGACTGAMYPLGLSMLGERIPEAGLARAYAWYLAIECVGSLLGAAAMGAARDWWGETSMFAVGLAGVGAVLLIWGVLRGKMHKEVPRADELMPQQAESHIPLNWCDSKHRYH